jgi:hypothetical protein
MEYFQANALTIRDFRSPGARAAAGLSGIGAYGGAFATDRPMMTAATITPIETDRHWICGAVCVRRHARSKG